MTPLETTCRAVAAEWTNGIGHFLKEGVCPSCQSVGKLYLQRFPGYLKVYCTVGTMPVRGTV